MFTHVNKPTSKHLNTIVIPELRQKPINKMINTKNTLKILTAIFAVVFLATVFVSAQTLISVSPTTLDLNKEKNDSSFTITAVEDSNIAVTDTKLSEADDDGNTISISHSSIPSSLLKDDQSTIDVSSTFDLGLLLGTYNMFVELTATDPLDSSISEKETVNVAFTSSFCDAGAVGELKIKDVDVQNQGEGKDDEWNLLDEITIEVEVENDGDEDIDDVIVELGFFDSSGENFVGDLEFDNDDEEEFDLGNIDEDDKETIEFKFKVPADFDDGNYKLAVKAYSEDVGEDVECADESSDLSDDIFDRIDVERENDEGKFIAFDDVRVRPEDLTCGEEVTIELDVVNIGDEDQEQIRVNLEISELDIRLSQEIRKDVDQGDDETLSFIFMIPNNAADKAYTAELSAEYDYKRGSYRESSDEETSFLVRVVGCSPVDQPSGNVPGTSGRAAAITASLDSDAKAGEELTIRSTITNLKAERTSFVVSVAGYESWASLESISERIVTLNSGESRDVTITLNVDPDSEGQETLSLEARAGDEVETRAVAVNLEGSSSAGFDLGGNSLIWIIGAINVILIILIIIVAISLSRR
ncbi:MAG: hypothetical protein CL811_12900 [Colwelliaceae bacterium]|nr:hypothetical protein [Colwelliaceae bacterium]